MTLKSIMLSPTVMTWASLISRLGMSTVILPFIIVYLSETDISLWFFLIILNKMKDLFDFGYIDNISREISYKNIRANINEINPIVGFSNYIYKINALYCFVFIFLLCILGFYFKGVYNDYSFIELVAIILFSSISNSIFIFGNNYISFLFGMNCISKVKLWDTVFTILNIISLLLGIFLYPSILTLLFINSVWVILTVFRNRYISLNLQAERAIRETSFIHEKFLHIKKNARREYFASFFSVGFFQLFNYFISSFFPITVSNVYLLLDNIMEQIKNLSRVPFYVQRPKMASDLKLKGTLEAQSVRKYVFLSSLTFSVGIILFSIIAPYLLDIINSKVKFDEVLWLALAIYAAIERISAMHNQIYVILNNKVIMHTILPKVVILSACLSMIVYFTRAQVFIYPLLFSFSYFLLFYLVVIADNFSKLNCTWLYFDFNVFLLYFISFVLIFFL